MLSGYLPEPQKETYSKKYLVISGKRILSIHDKLPPGDFSAALDTDDVIYPAMINLHSHTKYNVLPLWKEARGQFANRFEWRSWPPYKATVTANLNPWISDPTFMCAAFRFSEIRALIDGTSHLQGASQCVENFAIHRVEDPDAFDEIRSPVQAPTDLLLPDLLGSTYQDEIFPLMNPSAWFEWRSDRSRPKPPIGYFKGFEIWQKNGPDPIQSKRYLEFQHKLLVGKTRYLAGTKRSAVIAHVSEGRRDDPYNRYEFDLLTQLGLDLPGLSVTHGVGIDGAGFEHMARRGMGLIWSPFSNLLLYGETADIEAAHRAGVVIALGSDWSPTGGRSVLEELKVAREYIARMELEKTITDRELYKMVTENAATLLRVDDVAGKIEPDKLANLVLMKKEDANPYTNFVLAQSGDIQLVIVDGKPLYGEGRYLKKLGESSLEFLPASQKECGFQKALVTQKTEKGSALNVDRFSDLYSRLVSAMKMRKKERETAGDPEKYLVDPPTLYACDDPEYRSQVDQFLEGDFLLDNQEWKERRREYQLSDAMTKKMAEMFDLSKRKHVATR